MHKVSRLAAVIGIAGLVAAVGLSPAAATPIGSTAPARETVASSQRLPLPEMQRALDAIVEAGAVGVQVEVVDGGRRWVGTSGTARLDSPRPVPAGGQFRAGSVTKSFVSTVLLQLVAEGRVGLDAPIERYLPGVVPNGERITVRQILNHTSGLFNFVEDPEAFPMSGSDFLTGVRFRTYTPEELVGAATAHPPYFQPGQDWHYSNSNYVLAGMIIERVTGNEYSDEIERRIIRPLGLRDTDVPGTRTSIPGRHAHGYLKVVTDDGERVVDVTRLNPSWAGAAGEIISTTHDLNLFYTALFGGRLLPPEQLDAMLTTVSVPVPDRPDLRYGLGIGERRLSCGAKVVGHDGGIHGFATDSVHSADNRRHVSVSINLPDGFAPEAMFVAWEQAVTAAFCGGASQPATAA